MEKIEKERQKWRKIKKKRKKGRKNINNNFGKGTKYNI